MADTCDYLQSRLEIVGVCSDADSDPWCECLRPSGHKGPHLIKRFGDGQIYVVWEEDVCPEGTCEFCDGEDSTDWCLVFGQVSKEKAEALIASGDLVEWSDS